MKLLTVAAIRRDPFGGAAGTIISCNEELRRIGHHVDELWHDDLGQRWVQHHNLHSLIEKPRSIRRTVCNHPDGPYDFVIVNEPQGYQLANHLNRKDTNTRVVTLSQGVEKRLRPLLAHWRRQARASHQQSPRSLLSPLMGHMLDRQWTKCAHACDSFLVVNQEDCDFLNNELSISTDRIHLSW